MRHSPPRPTLFPYTTLFRSSRTGPRRGSHRRATAEGRPGPRKLGQTGATGAQPRRLGPCFWALVSGLWRSEEHTSELQSRGHLVCRLLLENKKSREIADERK